MKGTIDTLKFKGVTDIYYSNAETNETSFKEGDYVILNGRFIGIMEKHIRNNEAELKMVELNDNMELTGREYFFEYVENEIYGMHDLIKCSKEDIEKFINDKKTNQYIKLDIIARELKGKQVDIDYLLNEIEGLLRCHGYGLVKNIDYLVSNNK